MAQDRDGRVYFFSQSGTTRLSHYTELQVPGGPPVRLLHDGQLTNEQRENIRANVARSREDVNEAIETLSKGLKHLGPETRQLMANQLGIHPMDLTDRGVERINNRLKQTADGLYSPKIEIKLVDRMYSGEVGRNKIQRAPYRELPGRARIGRYRDESPNIDLKMTKSQAWDLALGAEKLIQVVAQAAAEANGRDGAALARFTGELKIAIANDEHFRDLGIDQTAVRHSHGALSRLPEENPPLYPHEQRSSPRTSFSDEYRSETTNAIYAHIHAAAARNDIQSSAERSDTARETGKSAYPAEEDEPPPDAVIRSIDRESVERQLAKLAETARGYSPADRRAITKALLEGLNNSERDEVLRGLKRRERSSAVR